MAGGGERVSASREKKIFGTCIFWEFSKKNRKVGFGDPNFWVEYVSCPPNLEGFLDSSLGTTIVPNEDPACGTVFRNKHVKQGPSAKFHHVGV